MGWYYPKGMVLNLYKYYVRPKGNYQEVENFFQEPPDGKSRTLTVFGNFDRVGFVPVDCFDGYQKEVCGTYPWLGNRQSVMLYAVMPEKERRYCFQKDSRNGYLEDVFGISDGANQYPVEELAKKNRPFLMITFLYAAGAAKASLKSYDRFLAYCQDGISRIVKKYNSLMSKDLRYEVFGTFNSAEIAVVWDGDSFTDTLYLVDHLRHMEFMWEEETGETTSQRMFISSYTFVALTGDKPEELWNKERCGGMLLQLAGRTGGKAYESITTYLQDNAKDPEGSSCTELLYCAGEYDVVVQQKDTKLMPKFCSGSSHPFDTHNENFCEQFLESTTRLCYRKEDVADLKRAIDPLWYDEEKLLSLPVKKEDRGKEYSTEKLKVWERLQRQSDEEPANIRSKYQKLREKCVKLWPTSDTGFLRMLDLLYVDYVQCVTTAVDHLWVKDFDAQFETVLDVLLGMRVQNDDGTFGVENVDGCVTLKGFSEMAQAMFNSLQQQICHIADAGKLFFEEPRSHFSYTGQWDLLMHTYYGVLKALLEAVYRVKHPQSPLCPLLNFEPIDYLRSKIYHETYDASQVDTGKRFVAITLPYMAWDSLGLYIPVLIHELYHYVAPYNRKKRNYYLGCILLAEFLSHGVLETLQTITQNALLKNHSDPNPTEETAVRYTQTVLEIEVKEALEQYVANKLPWEQTGTPGLDKDAYFEKFTKWIAVKLVKGKTFWLDICAIVHTAAQKVRESDGWLQSWNDDPETRKTAEKALATYEEEFDRLSKWVDWEPDKNPGLREWQNAVGKNAINRAARPVYNVIKELLPDVAMAYLSGMDVSAYLVHFAAQLNNRTIKPEEVTQEARLRIAVILCWLEGWTGSTDATQWENAKEDFYKMYGRLFPEKETEGTISSKRWMQVFETAHGPFRDHLLPMLSWWKDLIAQEFLPCLEDTEKLAALRGLCAKYYDLLRGDLDETAYKKAVFDLSIQITQSLQLQHNLREAEVARQKTQEELKTGNMFAPHLKEGKIEYPNFSHPEVYTLNETAELNKQLLAMTQALKRNHKRAFPMDGEPQLWYRGVWNAEYEILPSILVNFFQAGEIPPKDFQGKNRVGTLREYQQYLLERFKFRADGAPEQLRGYAYDPGEYLALMQHYSQYTGFLDWSEDAYTSLYFALEGFVDDDCDKMQAQEGKDAGFYVLDPMLYNRARRMLMQSALRCGTYCSEEKCMTCRSACNKVKRRIKMAERPYADTWQGWLGHIPNLSIPQERTRYWMFLGENGPAKRMRWIKKDRKLFYSVGEKRTDADLHLPLAVYTSRLNPRIRAQSGFFMAYDLDAPAVWDKRWGENYTGAHLFKYIALGQIQENFLKRFPNERPFLLKLKIDRSTKEQLGAELRSLGISRYRIYPELEHLKQKK